MRDSMGKILPAHGEKRITSRAYEAGGRGCSGKPEGQRQNINIKKSKAIPVTEPPLWSRGQSSWLQIERSGFDFRHYQIF
jgi:hypothetical protein